MQGHGSHDITDWEHAGLQARWGLTGIMEKINPGCVGHHEIMQWGMGSMFCNVWVKHGL